MSISFPGESAEYRAERARLLEQEVELRRVTESVAAARRTLPPGGVVPENYIFDGEGPGGAPTEVTLVDLFEPGKDTLFIYNMMFPRAPDEDLPCPSCTQFLDSFDGVAEHASQRINVAVVVKTALPRALAHAENRGWRRLRFLSSAGNTYNRDYHGETDDGRQQLPMLNVFHRYGNTIRNFWGSELLFEPPDPGQDPRHGETIDPLWNLFDFTPDGRGTDWYPDLSYVSPDRIRPDRDDFRRARASDGLIFRLNQGVDMASRLNPYISFDGNARVAMEFYGSVFGGTLTLNTYGEIGGLEGAGAAKIMHGMLESAHGFTLMGADGPPGGEHKPGNNIAVSLSGDEPRSCAATGRSCPSAAPCRSRWRHRCGATSSACLMTVSGSRG